MSREALEDYRWLVGDRAAEWLARLAESTETLVQVTRRLRKDLTAAQAHLVLEQHELRRRAGAKFPRAERMFFTRFGLEQATDLRVAQLKAQRFPSGRPIVDLCCGIGGDLIALAQRASVSAVDLNPIHALLAEANCRAWELTVPSVLVADVADHSVGAYAAWHIDPDRRSQGSRTTRPELCQPPLATMERMRERVPHGAVKLAPASQVPLHWQQIAERQWIGSGRECRQQVIWFGDLATHPGRRTAIVVDRHGLVSPLLVGDSDNGTLETSDRLGRFVYEPHAAVLAAGLNSTLAAQFELSALDPKVAYLTGNDRIDDPRLSCFEVM
jgi:hypothetical protein